MRVRSWRKSQGVSGLACVLQLLPPLDVDGALHSVLQEVGGHQAQPTEEGLRYLGQLEGGGVAYQDLDKLN